MHLKVLKLENDQAGIYLFKMKHENAKNMSEICSKLKHENDVIEGKSP